MQNIFTLITSANHRVHLLGFQFNFVMRACFFPNKFNLFIESICIRGCVSNVQNLFIKSCHNGVCTYVYVRMCMYFLRFRCGWIKVKTTNIFGYFYSTLYIIIISSSMCVCVCVCQYTRSLCAFVV